MSSCQHAGIFSDHTPHAGQLGKVHRVVPRSAVPTAEAAILPVRDLPVPDDTGWLIAAVDLAHRNVADGGGPFGAFIVQDGVELGRGVNRVTRDNDPTAHAEVCAIRAACAGKGDFSLAGATLYTSCEPCPLCLSASLWARVDRVLYAADRYDAARGGFDDLEFYELFARDRSQWSTSVAGVSLPGATLPFDAWLASSERVAY